jgi:hypothetical protein
VDEEATGKEAAQRGSGDSGPKEKVWKKEHQAKKKRKGDLDTKKKCLPNEEQQRKQKKAEDDVDLNEHEKRISRQ